jgi:hypothetical protein
LGGGGIDVKWQVGVERAGRHRIGLTPVVGSHELGRPGMKIASGEDLGARFSNPSKIVAEQLAPKRTGSAATTPSSPQPTSVPVPIRTTAGTCTHTVPASSAIARACRQVALRSNVIRTVPAYWRALLRCSLQLFRRFS